MKIAVIGSRTFNNYHLLKRVLDRYKEVNNISYDLIVSGGANGADKLSEAYAFRNDIETLIFYPDYKKHGKSAPFVRNTQIIDNGELVFSFWDGQSRGTLDSMKKAKERGKKVVTVYFGIHTQEESLKSTYEIDIEFPLLPLNNNMDLFQSEKP